MSPDKAKAFHAELTTLLNKHNVDTHTNTPDFILAQYLMASLSALSLTIFSREAWSHKEPTTEGEAKNG